MSSQRAESPGPPASHDDPPQPYPAGAQVLARVSTELAQLHRHYYGRGPTKVKTYMVNDKIVCTLRGGSTTVGKALVDQGRDETDYQIRRSFQDAMERQFRAVVEHATGRRVIAYVSQVRFDPDIAVELFVLEPADPPLVGHHEEDFGT
jgi:uncharacterized protein YbcI